MLVPGSGRQAIQNKAKTPLKALAALASTLATATTLWVSYARLSVLCTLVSEASWCQGVEGYAHINKETDAQNLIVFGRLIAIIHPVSHSRP